MNRKPGFYWVRDGERWVPAEWLGELDGWIVLGWRSNCWADADIDEVGPALVPSVLVVEGRT